MKIKICSVCKIAKPVSAFGRDGSANYLRYDCRECARTNAKIVNKIRKTAPAISATHVCPICKKDEVAIRATTSNPRGVWCLDHDHSTNEFRDYLCHKCNMGLGNFNDDPVLMESAAQYLLHHSQRIRESKQTKTEFLNQFFTN